MRPFPDSFELSFALFGSALGPCAIAWGSAGVTHLELPAHADEAEAKVQARLLARVPDAKVGEPPPALRPVVEAMRRHLGGRPESLESAAVDLANVPPFHRRVYEALRRVPPGATVTYAELAALAGSPGASRAVGQAMAKNPCPLLVPCHRVLAAGGKPGGFSAAGGNELKARMLAIEGVALRAPGTGPGPSRRPRPS